MVPVGFHLTTDAYRRFVSLNGLDATIAAALGKIDQGKPASLDLAARTIQAAFLAAQIPGEVAGALAGAYGDLPGTDPAVAVRSSATAEDLPEASFAGQQDSYLNVRGADKVLEATKKCWSSLWTARAISYRQRHEIDPSVVALAVVVQLLVDAEVAGIAFTVNPVNGNRDEMLVSASWGLGDAIVGGRVTPDEYVLDKSSGTVVQQVIAEKETMTVRVDGGTQDQPVPANLRRVPTLEPADLAELGRLAIAIERLYEMPMDIEWTLADGSFSIVQARPITTLKAAQAAPADDWTLSDPKARYMRASIVDMMPDPLSPLFATLGLRAYNAMLEPGIGDLMGSRRRFLPENLVTTIRHYAYMRVNFTGRELWGMLTVLSPRMPRLIRQGPTHFREVALPNYMRKVEQLQGKRVETLSSGEIWRDVHDLAYAAFYHLSTLQVDTLGAAAGSEGLFSALYRRFYRHEGDPDAPAFLMGYDTLPMQSEKSLFDLAAWARTQPALASWLLSTPTEQIAEEAQQSETPHDVPLEAWLDFRRRLHAHLDAYGHMFYDLDFAKPVPADEPTPLIESMKMYLRGEGQDPHQRQRKLEQRREAAVKALQLRAKGLRGWAVRKALGWAQSLGQVREDSVASIGLAYPRLRELLAELGQRLNRAGAISSPDDIYWLEEDEISAVLPALDDIQTVPEFQASVEERKHSFEIAKDLMPPTQIPPSDTYMGIPIQAFVPGEGGQEGNRLKGVGASAGCVTGNAVVLHGPQDFDQMQPGVILVAKMTTPAWTPLFAMASAIVTDIGGPLSHGSIVAREYGIPAVLGTVAATRLISSGQQITVDGDQGYVTLIE